MIWVCHLQTNTIAKPQTPIRGSSCSWMESRHSGLGPVQPVKVLDIDLSFRMVPKPLQLRALNPGQAALGVHPKGAVGIGNKRIRKVARQAVFRGQKLQLAVSIFS